MKRRASGSARIKAGKETEPRIRLRARLRRDRLRGYYRFSLRELAGYADRVAGIITCETKNHEDLVSECWTAEGSDVARQGCHDRNFQGAGQRAGSVSSDEKKLRRPEREKTGLTGLGGFCIILIRV